MHCFAMLARRSEKANCPQASQLWLQAPRAPAWRQGWGICSRVEAEGDEGFIGGNTAFCERSGKKGQEKAASDAGAGSLAREGLKRKGDIVGCV